MLDEATEHMQEVTAAAILAMSALGDPDAEVFTRAARLSIAKDMPGLMALMPELLAASDHKAAEWGTAEALAHFRPSARLWSMLGVVGYVEDMLENPDA